jgi:hypothetical protein
MVWLGKNRLANSRHLPTLFARSGALNWIVVSLAWMM